MRSPREAVLLMLALLPQACSATRAYEGPVRPREDVARITKAPNSVGEVLDVIGRGITFDSLCFVQLEGVDDVEEFDSFSDGSVEVLPGRHSVRATLKARVGMTWTHHPAYVASFDAQAGHEYELKGRASSLTGEVGFDVWDVGDDLIVASTDLGPQECVTARIEWDGRHWIEADWGHFAAITTATYVPSGDVLSSWREAVELQFIPAREPPDLDEVLRRKLEKLERAGDGAMHEQLESAPGLRVYTWSFIEHRSRLVQQGVTCLRSGPDGCHVLGYALRGVLDPQAATAWAARFKAAELLSTEY